VRFLTQRLRFGASLALFFAIALTAASASAATKWTVATGGSNSTFARSLTPSAPTGVTATCVSSTTTKVTVTWTAASHATGYTVYDSKTSGTYTSIGTTTTRSFTTAALTSGRYRFEVATSIGTKWKSGRSSQSSSRTINSATGTCS
jgi:hypothetical protein